MSHSDQDAMRAFEERLRSWVPSPGGLDRDRMLFEAGRAEAEGPIRGRISSGFWRLATAAAVLLASGLGWAWQNERSQRRALELAFARPVPPPSVTVGSTSELMTKRQERETAVDPTSYLALVQQAKRREQAAILEPERAEPGPVQKIQATSPPRPVPLRPHDYDRVIAL